MELKFRYRFEAAHRFTNSTSAQCMTPHGHTWHATLHLRSTNMLNKDNMVVEFSKVKSYWKTFVTEVLDHSYMCNSKDALIPALLAVHETARLLKFPGDPTTEMIALLLYSKVESMLAAENIREVQIAGVTIEETPTNSLFCPRESYLENNALFKNISGWWSKADPRDRSYDDSPTANQ